MSRQGYAFADLRSLPLTVNYDYEPSLSIRASSALRIEPGLTLLEIQRLALRAVPFPGSAGELVLAFAAAGLAIGFFLVRLKAQWRPVDSAHVSRVETQSVRPGRGARVVIVGLLVLATPILLRATVLGPMPTQPVPPVAAASLAPPLVSVVSSSGWELSTYFTAVEKFYSGRMETLRGCPQIDCVNGTDVLGRYPVDFIAAVKEEVGTRHPLCWELQLLELVDRHRLLVRHCSS